MLFVAMSIIESDEAPLTEAKFLLNVRSASTKAEYQKDMGYYFASGGVLPASEDMVARYIEQLALTVSVATIEKRLVSLHVAHLDQGYPSPVKTPRIKRLMQGVRRTLGVAQRQVKAIDKDVLLDMWSVAAKRKTNWRARTIALLAIGWAGAFRRSELVGLTWESVTWLKEGIEILLPKSKVDQSGAGFIKYIPRAHGDRCPVQALSDWQAISGHTAGVIFQAVNRHDQILDRQLSAHGVATIVKQLIVETGRNAENYSGHSLRAGFVTAGALAGIPSYQLMQVTGHRSEATLSKYVRIAKRRAVPSLL